MVNELRGGFQWSPNDFFANVTPDQFADQDGYGLSFPVNTRPSPADGTPSARQPRNTTTWSVDNTLNWLRGAHSLSMGGGYAGVLNRAEHLQRRAERSRSASTRTSTRRRGMFNADELPVGDRRRS